MRMQLLPGDAVSDSIAFTGIYELPLSRQLCRLAKSGGQMVDVGANLGYFSLLWAAATPRNSVVAFEASPRNTDYLRRNVAANGFAKRVEIRSQAIGKEPGEMDFDPGPDDQTGWGGLSLLRSDRTTRVPVIRLDDALSGVDEINLLKIDTEGADTWAILGAERLLRERRIKHIWWEQNKPRMKLLQIPEHQAAQFLAKFGFEIVRQSDDSNVTHWCATLSTGITDNNR